MAQMSSALTTISMSDLILDKEIYPRNAIDHRRVDMFAENMRDGFTFEPIDVEVHPEERGKYRIPAQLIGHILYVIIAKRRE